MRWAERFKRSPYAPLAVWRHCEYMHDFACRFLLRSGDVRNKARKDLPKWEAVLEKWASGETPYVCVALHRTVVEQMRQIAS